MSFTVKIITPKNFINDIYHRNIFECWRNTWQDSLETDFCIGGKVYSDDFMRQDIIISIFYEQKCAGMAFLKHMDFNISPTIADSWFAPWPEYAIEKILKFDKKFTICSNFTVAKEFRGKIDGIKTKDLLSFVVIKYFCSTQHRYMLGTSRKSKGVDKSNYKFGGIPIAENLFYEKYQEAIDLILFPRLTLKEKMKELKDSPFSQIYKTSLVGQIEMKNAG